MSDYAREEARYRRGTWKYAVGALFVRRKCVKFALVRVSMLLVEKGKKIAIIVVIVVSEIEK